MNTPDIEKCDCKEMSCKIGCDRRHTHKTFDCGICKPDTKKNESCTDPLHNIKHDELGGLSYHEYEEKLDKTMTSFTPDIEWEKELWGLLYEEYGDVGQNGNIKSFIRTLLTSRDTYWKERIEELELSCIDDRLLGKTDEYLDGYNTSTQRWREQRDALLVNLK